MRRYTERLAILHETDRAILSARSPAQIAQAALERLGRIVPMWCATVTMFDSRTGKAFIVAAVGAEVGGRCVSAPPESEDVAAANLRSLHDTRGFIIDDVADTTPEIQAACSREAMGVRSCIRVPLTTGGQLLGALSVYSDTPHAYDLEHLDVAREIADSLATAIRQAELFDEVQAGRERLSDVSRRLIRAEEEERRRIAGELHDEIGQALTALKLNLRAAVRAVGTTSTKNRLEESIALVERTIDQVRDLSLDLRPALLDDLGLVSALRSYIGKMGQWSGIKASFAADPSLDRLDPETETACYRIAQEALTNVARHSGAVRVSVVLEKSDCEIRLIIRDDGRGFDVSAATARAASGSSLGLLGMRERASLLRGQFAIASDLGSGTEVRATLPVRRSTDRTRGIDA